MSELQENFPEIAEQFDEKLNNIKVSEVSRTSNGEYYFTCLDKNHTWKAKLYNRTLNNFYDCPVCTNRIIQRGVNDLLTTVSGVLLKQLDCEKNVLNNIEINELHPRSKINIWWVCQNNHSWLESPYNRSRGTGCPYCSGKRLSLENSLLNASYKIIKEYSISNRKKLEEVSLKSRTLVEWECFGKNFNGVSIKHFWRASPYNRIYKNQECPYCANKKTFEGFNDLKVTHPEFYEELANKSMLVRFNESKRVEWVCGKCSNEYSASPRSKIIRGDKCQNCSNSKVSGMELELLEFIKNIYKGNIIHGDRIMLNGKELDIYLPELKIAFEFNGDFWHSDAWLLKTQGVTARELHSIKKQSAREVGIELFYVWEVDWLHNKVGVKEGIIHVINGTFTSKLLKKLE